MEYSINARFQKKTAREYWIVWGRILIKSIRANSCPTCPSPSIQNQLLPDIIPLAKKCERMYVSGVHFDTSTESLVNEITTAVKVYANGAEDFLNDPANKDYTLNTKLSCEGRESRWNTGDLFFK